MARISVKPQVRSSRPSRPRSLDYNVIEQIANGIEKMVVQWNHAKEARMIRPYTSSGSSSSRSHTAPPPVLSSKITRPATAIASVTAKQSESTVQEVEDVTASSSSTLAGKVGEGATEMSIFLRSQGSLDQMVIPNLSGIVRAEMVKQRQEQLNGDHIMNSSWFLKAANTGGDSNQGLAQEEYDNGLSSARTDQDSIQVTTTSEDDGTTSTIGITPRLECALERIQELNIKAQEVTEQLPDCNINRELAKLNPSHEDVNKEAAQAEKDVLNGLEELGVVSDRTVSVCKTDTGCSEGTLDGSSTPQMSNRVDDWTDTSEIVGDENIRDLISYSKKKEAVKEKEELLDDYKVKIEELQIALLECSTEYEVKIVEMKMMMLNMKSQYRQQMITSANGNVKLFEPQAKDFSLVTNNNKTKQNIEFLKKQMQKLKHDKENLSREVFNLKKKQRQSEKQKKSLDDALNKVSCLRRELAKREEEILDSHLREKEHKAQLNELHHALQSARAAQAEPGKLLALLPVLRNYLKSVKKQGQLFYEPNLMNSVDNFLQPQAPVRKSHLKAPLTASDYTKDNRPNPRVERIVGSVTKEIQALQKALEKLACGRMCHQGKEFQRMFGSYSTC